ncbi:MAG TPA: hypothetical protein VFE34_16365 [Dongiaceae bacterium]|nr:hypothetical protein [Dongiaceae bacterium]
MRRHRRRVLFAWLLGMALFILVLVIYRGASDLLSNVSLQPEAAAAPDPPASVPPSPLFAMPSRESLAVILERPVFSETRRPSGDAGTVHVTPSDFRLAGVVISVSERSALIQRGAARMVERLKEGDDVGGWMLVEIGLDRIKIRRGAVEAEMLLDYAAPAPSTPRTESRKERAPIKPAMHEAARQSPSQPDGAETGLDEEVRQ